MVKLGGCSARFSAACANLRSRADRRGAVSCQTPDLKTINGARYRSQQQSDVEISSKTKQLYSIGEGDTGNATSLSNRSFAY